MTMIDLLMLLMKPIVKKLKNGNIYDTISILIDIVKVYGDYNVVVSRKYLDIGNEISENDQVYSEEQSTIRIH